ncbi:hypothetical protein ZWY2020_014014 [Hordeum vulgare]|nr:hypothetical protein ZWY2020_014014 [Hordeum vulgare]
MAMSRMMPWWRLMASRSSWRSPRLLTQSDANNGGVSVPRYCVDIHLSRGWTTPPTCPCRPSLPRTRAWTACGSSATSGWGTALWHLLTTGWSAFVNRKKLVAGDSIVFLRGDGGNLHGIRRAVAGVRAEDVVEAARLAGSGQPFEVGVLFPRASTLEFCVPQQCERAMRCSGAPGWCPRWHSRPRTQSCISWFMGKAVAGVQVVPYSTRWPQSPEAFR